MIRSTLYLVILALSFIACKSSEKKTYRLSDDQLVNLMFDMHLADVLLTEFPKHQQDSIKAVYLKRMTEVYVLSEEEIHEEIHKLESEPEKMKLIIGRIKTMADSLQ